MNKMIKQLLAVTIIICVGMNTVHVEAKSKKVIMQVGDTKKVSCLKANKKYIFSKKKIVKINKKGKIVALKKGKTKIYCGNKKICDVTVKNAYFVCDLKQANKVVVTNLNHGNTFELEKDDIVKRKMIRII